MRCSCRCDIERLKRSLNAPIANRFAPYDSQYPDVLGQLLAGFRSPATRDTYRKALNYFFVTMTGVKPDRDSVLEFLHLDRSVAVSVVLKYKSIMIERGLKEASVNVRLAAIKALVARGRSLGVCDYSLDEVKNERASSYRDTSGLEAFAYKKVLSTCDLTSSDGKRDYAILRLLWDNALRRGEISRLNVGDVDLQSFELTILGKGRGTTSSIVGLSRGCAKAIQNWLEVREFESLDEPLFIALDRCHQGKRLSGDGIYKILRKHCQMAGISKIVSPHRVRHGSITQTLNLTNGNYRKVRKFSRHKNINTIQIYDDNRERSQQELSDLLADSLD